MKAFPFSYAGNISANKGLQTGQLVRERVPVKQCPFYDNTRSAVTFLGSVKMCNITIRLLCFVYKMVGSHSRLSARTVHMAERESQCRAHSRSLQLA
jgi:hypothetical protein